jgi:hypothetical protein
MNFPRGIIFSWESVILRTRVPPIYYSVCSVLGRLVTFECLDQFWQFLLIIACVGDISKLQLYIWLSYGQLAEIKKILLTVRSSLFRSLCIPIEAFFVFFCNNTYFEKYQNHMTKLKPSIGTLDQSLKMRKHLRFCYWFFLASLRVQLQWLRRALGLRITETIQLFLTNRRSVRNRGSNPGHLRGRQRR